MNDEKQAIMPVIKKEIEKVEVKKPKTNSYKGFPVSHTHSDSKGRAFPGYQIDSEELPTRGETITIIWKKTKQIGVVQGIINDNVILLNQAIKGN